MIRAPSTAGSRRPSRAPKTPRWKTLVNLLRLAWAFLLIMGEALTFQHRIHRCNWPKVSGAPKGAKHHRVLVIADPQIPDSRSYPTSSFIQRWIKRKLSDAFSAKAFRIILSYHRPDAIIFLGDLMDGGVTAVDRLEHASYAQRFRQLFPAKGEVLYVMGNRDVGLQGSKEAGVHAREQFRDAFGPTQGVREIGNHSFIFVDSMGLLEERKEAPVAVSEMEIDDTSALGFVRNLTNTYSTLPRILLSHIPLYRESGTSCGPSREARTSLNMLRDQKYQNLLDQDVTSVLLQYTSPSLVLSGNDHDYCAIQHKFISPASYTSSVDEITVRSFGTDAKVRHPGFQLLSLCNPTPDLPPTGATKTYATQPCLLPNQHSVYKRFYIPFALLSIILIILPKLRRALQISTRRVSTVKTNRLPSHMSSHSRGSFGGSHRRKASSQVYHDASESEDSDYDYSPTYGNHDVGYSYFPSGDEDGTPSPSPLYESRRPSYGRMRRVSRLNMWEGRKRGGGKEEFVSLLQRLGPLYRGLIRPGTRLAKRLSRATRLDAVVDWMHKVGASALIKQTTREACSVFWVAMLVYLAIYFRWTWL